MFYDLKGVQEGVVPNDEQAPRLKLRLLGDPTGFPTWAILYPSLGRVCADRVPEKNRLKTRNEPEIKRKKKMNLHPYFEKSVCSKRRFGLEQEGTE